MYKLKKIACDFKFFVESENLKIITRKQENTQKTIIKKANKI